MFLPKRATTRTGDIILGSTSSSYAVVRTRLRRLGNTNNSILLPSAVSRVQQHVSHLRSSSQQQRLLSSSGGFDNGILESLANRLSPATREQVLKELQANSTLLGSSSSSSATSSSATLAAVSTAAANNNHAQVLASEASEIVPEPTRADLKAVMLTTGIPFIGFGIMDNAILIIAGDAIDTSLGVAFGISTMCAAAIGNIISDVAGIMCGTIIEDFCAKYLNLPTPNLTTAQRQLRSVRFANQFGCGLGIVIGCIIGMFPLLYIDSNKIQARKREAHLDSIFRDVITEAGGLIGAQRTCLYLVVDKPNEDGDNSKKKTSYWSSRQNKNNQQHPIPAPNGKYLYAKYDADAAVGAQQRQNKFRQSDRYVPLGRGIVSRAALTGEAWNIYDVRSEPDFAPELGEQTDTNTDNDSNESQIRNMVCVPVLDAEGRAIAVLQALNKVSRGRIGMGKDEEEGDDDDEGMAANTGAAPKGGFTSSDVQVLKALASHISVSLQRMSEEGRGEDADMRLRDTITMLKEYGLQGLASTSERKMLFPED